tara:strand:+ start:328 stop:591 length:264 start_codon:yes stop_codon:yes gene_type:complete
MVEKLNIFCLSLQIDSNQTIKNKVLIWKICKVKYVQFARDLLNGGENGKIVGMKLFIVQIDAEEEDKINARNFHSFTKSAISKKSLV